MTMNQKKQPRFWQSFGLAFALEVAIIGGGLSFMLLAPQHRLAPVVPLVIESVPEAVVPQPVMAAAPKPTPPEAKPVPIQKQAVARAMPDAPPPTPIKELAKAESAPIAAPSAVAAPTSAVAMTAPAQPAALPQVKQAVAQPAADPSATYNAQLAASVQAAFEVPMVAQELGFKGRTRVEFSLRDGRIASPRIIQGSGLGVADRAAIKAVQSAVYPPPPEALKGREGIYQIWVACL
jgi:periplasmic protein TonB